MWLTHVTHVTKMWSYHNLHSNYLIISYHIQKARAYTLSLMTPAEELVLHLVNLLAAASFLFLAASRDAILLYSTWFNRVPVHTSRLSGQQWIDKLVNRHDRRFHNELGLRKHTFNKLTITTVSTLLPNPYILHLTVFTFHTIPHPWLVCSSIQFVFARRDYNRYTHINCWCAHVIVHCEIRDQIIIDHVISS